MATVGCGEQTLLRWIDMYLEKGLSGLVKPISHQSPQRLNEEQKQQLKKMLLEQKPTDYGLVDRYIWTGKIIVEVIKAKWDVELKDSRIYEILSELGLSHQKSHRDYENADQKVQKEFVDTVKKN